MMIFMLKIYGGDFVVNNESVVAKVIRGENINIDKYSQSQKVYDFLNYYEMNLYAVSNQLEYIRKIEDLKKINGSNTNKYTELMKVICDSLSQHNIGYCVLVGIPFTNRYHVEKNKRLQEDIDFFIDERELDRISIIMEELGFYVWNYNRNKKHVTYINVGKTGKDTSRNGRCTVKFYKRMTDSQYKHICFNDIKKYVEKYEGVCVLCPEMTLLHLILHTHYYDFHPKIMCDIYALINSELVDVEKYYELVDFFELRRLSRIVLGVLKRMGLNTDKYQFENKNEEFICDVLASKNYWEKIFVRLNKNELSFLRCYLIDENNYKKRFNDILFAGLERRVSAMREEFVIDDF